jgi:hypothetical protein
MFKVLFKIDDKWNVYATNLTASDAAEMGRMLADLDYEVSLEQVDNQVTEVDYLLGAVAVLQQELRVSHHPAEVADRLLCMLQELVDAVRRERDGVLKWITPAPEFVSVEL